MDIFAKVDFFNILASMSSKEAREALSVTENASTDQIYKSYKRLVSQYHPNINKESWAVDKALRLGVARDILISS